MYIVCVHTHTHTKEGKGEGRTPHSPFRTRPTTHSFPIATFRIGEEKCFKGAAERRDRVYLPDVPGQGIPQNGSKIRESSLTITICFDNPWPRNSKKRLIGSNTRWAKIKCGIFTVHLYVVLVVQCNCSRPLPPSHGMAIPVGSFAFWWVQTLNSNLTTTVLHLIELTEILLVNSAHSTTVSYILDN